MQVINQKYFYPDPLTNVLDLSDSSITDQQYQECNTLSQKKQQQTKIREKQALNELKFFSEYDEQIKQFRAWGDESMVDQQDHNRKISGNQTRNKCDKENINYNQKNSCMNTLNEMSMGLKKLESWDNCKKNNQEGQINKSTKHLNTFNRGVCSGKQKQNIIEYSFYSGNIISDLKKLRDDLQDSPDRLAYQKAVNNTTDCKQIDNLKQKQSSLKVKVIQQKEQDFTQKPRSISTTTQQKSKDSNNTIQRQPSIINTSDSNVSFNNPFSNLLRGKETQQQNTYQISHLKHPSLKQSISLNQNSISNQSENITIKIESQEDINNYDNNNIKDKYQTNDLSNIQSAIEYTQNTPKEQVNIWQKNSINFVMQKRKNRISSDLELYKKGFQKEEKYQAAPIRQQLYNSCLDLYDNLVNQETDKSNNVKEKQSYQIQHQRYSSQGNINEQRIDSIESNQIKKSHNDTLKNYKQVNSKKEKQAYYTNCKQQNEEEILNLKKGSQQTLKQSISISFQQNDENMSCEIYKTNIIEQFNKESARQQNKDSQDYSQNLLIHDEFRDSKLIEQNYHLKENHLQNQRRKVTLSEINKISQQQENIIQSSPKIESYKVNFFEMMKNKIANGSHRTTRSQNFCKQSYQQVNTSFNQISSLSSQVTPKQNNNLQNNRIIQFSRESQNNNKISTSLNSARDIGNQNKNNQNQFYQINDQQKGRSQNLLQKRYSSIQRKSAKFEEDENLQEQHPSLTVIPKKIMKAQININENRSKIPIIQLLTKRIQRESTCQINKLTQENENQQTTKENSDQNQINKQNTINIKMCLVNSQDCIEQTTDRTPKVSQIQNNCQRQSQNVQFDDKIVSSQIMQVQALNSFQKTGKHIREIQRSIPKIPKPIAKIVKPVLLQLNQKDISNGTNQYFI